MSAYLCHHYQIGQIGAYVAANVRVSHLPYLIDRDAFNTRDMTVLGAAGIMARELARENIACLDHLHADTGGAARFLAPAASATPSNPATLTDFIALCIQQSRLPPDPAIHPATWWDAFATYEYQTNEHPQWSASIAYRVIERARRIAGDAMAAIANAPCSWALERERRPITVAPSPVPA